MTQAYKILFTVTLRHDYYANKACNDFTAVPAPDCTELIKQYHLIYRQSGNKIIVLTPAKEGKPEIEMDVNLVFRFYLFCNNVYFSQFTGWNQDFNGGKKFYASNQHNNFSEANRYLTRPMEKYSNDNEYNQGDLVVSDDGTVHECLQFNPKKPNSKALTDADFWRKLKDNKTQYVTGAEQLAFTRNLLSLVNTSAAVIRVDAFDNDKKDFKTKLVEHTVSSDGNRTETVKIFSSLPAGRYKLTVDNQARILYYDPAAATAWGVVEIHHHSELPADMQILAGKKLPVDKNDASKLAPKNFIIHFHNRSVLWRYNLRLMKPEYAISDSSPVKFSFEKIDSSFISKEPIPLTEEPLKSLALKKNSTALIDTLKNPACDNLNMVERKDPFDPQQKKTIRYLCSEMYLTI